MCERVEINEQCDFCENVAVIASIDFEVEETFYFCDACYHEMLEAQRMDPDELANRLIQQPAQTWCVEPDDEPNTQNDNNDS